MWRTKTLQGCLKSRCNKKIGFASGKKEKKVHMKVFIKLIEQLKIWHDFKKVEISLKRINSPEYINMYLWGAWGRWIQDPLFCQSTFWTFRWSFLLLELAFLLELCRFCTHTHTVLSLATNISQKITSQLLKVPWNILA